jgi:asparagine synthase (glutamine-hydrolysing)
MLGMIRHRGPDEFGMYLDDRAALGSARLSIVDLAGGQQPISNEDGSLWIVFNGEIFNYPELRAELTARGHRFKTSTDTEIIVHLYEEKGSDCLKELNGQFAIALWDVREGALFLARDRLGVRPLFYARQGGRLLFASEAKAVLAHPAMPARLDPVSLSQVFTFWSTLPSRTMFEGIHELPAGHFLVARQGGPLEAKAYYSLEFDPPPLSRNPATDEHYIEQLHDLLRDATRIRLRADVPVGAYLSGGLDSSLIAALVRDLGVAHLDTFSIAFSDPGFDESEHQVKMARFLGTEHKVVLSTYADIAEIFPEVVWHTETPLMRTAPAPMFLLSRLVRKHGYKVVLTGEGADEFLGGYDIFKEAKIRRFWASQPRSKWRAALFRRLYPDVQGLSGRNDSLLKAFFSAGMDRTDAPDYSHSIRWRNNRRACRFFSDEVAAAGAGEAAGINFPPSFHSYGVLEKAQYIEASIFLSQYLLSSQGDRVAMGNSVEGRYPFLDHRVVQFCARLPSRLKMRALTEKVLLRKMARRYLPEEIASRQKRPYRAPIHRAFLSASPPPYVREMLSDSGIKAAGLFKAEAVGRLVRKVEEGAMGETDGMALVGILSAQLLHHQFVSRFPAPERFRENDNIKVEDHRSCRRAACATIRTS